MCVCGDNADAVACVVGTSIKIHSIKTIATNEDVEEDEEKLIQY